MAITSPVKGIVEVNDELCRILGYERRELLKQSWADLTHPDDLQADVTQFERVMAGEIDGYCLDKRWIRKDGAIVDSIMAAQCDRAANGSVKYFVGLVQNITDRKHAESALRENQQELQDLTTRLIEAQELQTKYLARELHDVFGQRLAAIGMELARIGEDAGKSLGDPLMKITEQIGTLADDLHRISRQIHPAILDDLGLPAALRSECLSFSESYKTSAEFVADDVPRDIPGDIALCLYRVAQESLRNVALHAGDSTVSVRLRARPGSLELTVDDTGFGFDTARTSRKRGLGLVSMEERLRIVGGTLSVQSKHGDGTHVTASVPLAT